MQTMWKRTNNRTYRSNWEYQLKETSTLRLELFIWLCNESCKKMKYTNKQQMYISKNKDLFKIGSKFNSYDVDLSESEEHDREILNQFFELRRLGTYLAIRQPLKNGKVPDIAILSTPELILKEVMKSETTKRFEEKDYLGARKIKVRC